MCEEIERRGNVKVTNDDRAILAKAPIEVLLWVRDFTDRVFERGYTQGATEKGKPMPDTPEEAAEKLVGSGGGPTSVKAILRRTVAEAIRQDRTSRQ